MTSQAHAPDELPHRFEVVAAGASPHRRPPPRRVASLSLVAMIVLIGAEAIVRNVFGGSLEVVDEIGGYLLVIVTFLSMSVAEAHGAFHRVELVQARMGPRARVRLQIVVRPVRAGGVGAGDVAAGAAGAQRLALGRCRADAAADAAVAAADVHGHRHGAAVRRARALGAGEVPAPAGRSASVTPGFELVFVLALFVGLLCLGMTIPFAITVPSVALPADARRLHGPQRPRPDELGQHEHLHADGDPAVHPHGGYPAGERLSLRIYRGLAKLVSRLPGGLLQTNIAGCAIFSAISGSSIATAASIGRVALPQLERRNYNPRVSAGSLAAGGTLGILIPPSIAMIIYGTFTETSVAKLFMAGVMPGLVMTAMFMLYIAVHAKLDPSIGPRSRARATPASWPPRCSTCCPSWCSSAAPSAASTAGW